MKTLQIFADESCTTAQRHMVLGCVVAEAAALPVIRRALSAARAAARLTRELKWAKVSKAMYPGYAAIIDAYFALAKDDHVHFHALHVDCSTIQHNTYSGGDTEMGFNKLIYQLLLHTIGRRYGDNYDIEVFLDDRTHSRDPNEMTPMLNSALASRWDIETRPFRFVKFLESKDSDLLQMCDILIGAIGYRKNQQHRKPNAAKHKCDLAVHIGRSIGKVQDRPISSRGAHRFSLWNFRYYGGGSPKA